MHATTDLNLQLQAILADPDDDGARIAFADLLEEEGERDRAEFIRVQLALAAPCRLGYSDAYHVDDVCSACDDLRRRERQLLSSHILELTEFVTGPQDHVRVNQSSVEVWMDEESLDYSRWDFRRGFVESVTLSAADWLTHADALLAAHPIIEVTLTTWPALERLSSMPVLYRLFGRNDWRQCRYRDPDMSEHELARQLLAAAFPRVRTWHLPGETAE